MTLAEKKNIRGKTLQEQADEILRIAENYNVEQNFFFLTTFKRYLTQIGILQKIEAEMKDGDVLITKEYVKGRKNYYTTPHIGAYNSTSTAANRTVETLIKIVNTMGHSSEDAGGEDPLLKALLGGD